MAKLFIWSQLAFVIIKEVTNLSSETEPSDWFDKSRDCYLSNIDFILLCCALVLRSLLCTTIWPGFELGSLDPKLNP